MNVDNIMNYPPLAEVVPQEPEVEKEITNRRNAKFCISA